MNFYCKFNTKQLKDYIDKNNLYSIYGYPSLVFRCKQIFNKIDSIKNKSLLEIGGGEGFFALWAVANGANRVTVLEPEAEGSTNGVIDRGLYHKQQLNIPDERYLILPTMFQDFEAPENSYEVVLSYSSINHLEETACSNVHQSEKSRKIYRQLFQKIYMLLKPKGAFIISDSARFNFWNLIGQTSPFAPTIDWKKHQEPSLWIKLLKEASFGTIALDWHQFYPLRKFGHLTANRLLSSFTTSQFILTAKKPLEVA